MMASSGLLMALGKSTLIVIHEYKSQMFELQITH